MSLKYISYALMIATAAAVAKPQSPNHAEGPSTTESDHVFHPSLYTKGGRVNFRDGVDIIIDLGSDEMLEGLIVTTPFFINNILSKNTLAEFRQDQCDLLAERAKIDAAIIVFFEIVEENPPDSKTGWSDRWLGENRPDSTFHLIPLHGGSQNMIKGNVAEKIFAAKRIRLTACVLTDSGIAGRSDSVEVVVD